MTTNQDKVERAELFIERSLDRLYQVAERDHDEALRADLNRIAAGFKETMDSLAGTEIPVLVQRERGEPAQGIDVKRNQPRAANPPARFIFLWPTVTTAVAFEAFTFLESADQVWITTQLTEQVKMKAVIQ